MIPKRRGQIIVVSAPSGAGKTSLCREMIQTVAGLEYSISYTTRPPRPTEVNGRDYFFVADAEFRGMIERAEFAEWAAVYGHLYGTSESFLRRKMDRGIDVILDVDPQGALQLKQRFPNGVFVYVLPPSLDELRSRLRSRRSDSSDVVRDRLERAREEMRQFVHYTHLIINDDFKQASRDLQAVILAEKVRLAHMDQDWIVSRLLGEGAPERSQP
jgi:guanylate kinase